MLQYWLMKSEPHVFSFENLKNRPHKKAPWDGVRNYQARNFMRDQMKIMDKILFYHSSCDIPGIAGVAEVASQPYADYTAWDPNSPYFDPKSSQEKPRWTMIDVKWTKDFDHYVSLTEIKKYKELSEMRLVQKGNRLSVMPVTKEEFDFIVKLGQV